MKAGLLKIAMAMPTLRAPGPRIVTIAIAPSNAGKASIVSTTRITTVSAQPPA